MRKLSIKSLIVGVVVGALGGTTVMATTGIKSANLNNITVSFNDTPIALSSPLISIVKEDGNNMELYMPVRELLEYLGYNVNWDETKNNVNLTVYTAETDTQLKGSNDTLGRLRDHFEDDDEIMTLPEFISSQKFDVMGNNHAYDNFTANTSRYEINAGKDSDVIIKFNGDITQGRFKLLLISTDNKVVTVADMTGPSSLNVDETFSLPKGKHILKMVGLDADIEFEIELYSETADINILPISK